jgi:hypothetical protein
MNIRWSVAWKVVAVAAVLGIGVFAVLVVRAVDVETVGPADAQARFGVVQQTLGHRPPMLMIDATGAIRPLASGRASADTAPISRLQVLTYQVTDGRLVKATVPFWFFTLKRPAAQFVLRDTGVDLDRLGLTAAKLTAFGPGVIFDETRSNGDRVLIWTE